MKTLLIYSMILVLNVFFNPTCNGSDLTEQEKDGLRLMREEEKLAHDVYAVLYENWKIPVFNNISKAETRHFEAIGYLLVENNIEDPAFTEVGKFRNLELANLYDSLISKGSQSLIAALEVGAFIEEVDIKDLIELVNEHPDENIKIVYENLLRGSENHLRAFSAQLAFRDGDYSPKVLDIEVYNNIISSEHQRGEIANNCIRQDCPALGKGRRLN